MSQTNFRASDMIGSAPQPSADRPVKKAVSKKKAPSKKGGTKTAAAIEEAAVELNEDREEALEKADGGTPPEVVAEDDDKE